MTTKSCKCKCSVCDERITECSCGISEGDVDEEDGGEAEASHEDAVNPSEDDGQNQAQADEGVDDRPLFKVADSQCKGKNRGDYMMDLEKNK